MDAAVLLALIAELYGNILKLQTENAELRTQLQSKGES